MSYVDSGFTVQLPQEVSTRKTRRLPNPKRHRSRHLPLKLGHNCLDRENIRLRNLAADQQGSLSKVVRVLLKSHSLR